MQVILKSDVDHLGYAKDVVDVKRGYWRNFLRPRGLAETATPAMLRDLAETMERRRAGEAKNAAEAAELKTLIDRTSIIIGENAGPTGQLFGSVTAADISRVLEATRKLRIDAKKIQLDAPLKTIGTFQVPVDLGHGTKAELSVEVIEQKLTEEQLARLEATRRAEAEAEEAAQLKAEAKAAAAAAAARGEVPAAEGDAAAEGDDAAADETPADADAEA